MDKKEREEIIKSCHAAPTSGHLGTKKTLARVTERFMWPGVTKEVYAMVSILTGLKIAGCHLPFSEQNMNMLTKIELHMGQPFS